MATKKIRNSQPVYIDENDKREILEIVAPGTVNPETGEVYQHAHFVLACRKGGRLNMYLPDHKWRDWEGVAEVGDLWSGGWKFVVDPETGEIVIDPKTGRPKTHMVDDQVWDNE